MYKICVISATRAEYGLLSPLLRDIKDSDKLQLQLIITGTHLSKLYGFTLDQVEKDGFKVDEAIDIMEDGDNELSIVKTMANAQVKIAETLMKLTPDVVVVLGDRYELLPIASSCVILNIPLCHIHGGEITQGAQDELFRHAISKMSLIHFAATEEYADRLKQMGEQPNLVFNVGSLGVQQAQEIKLMTSKQIQDKINFVVDKKTLLVTFHPITTETSTQSIQMQALLDALSQKASYKILFTRPNSDLHRSNLNDLLDDYVSKHPSTTAVFSSLGQVVYLSAMNLCLAVVGNSSSGIIEAPSFKIPTINIGNRQLGRSCANSVIQCAPDKDSIIQALNILEDKSFNDSLKDIVNPYAGTSPSLKMVNTLINLLDTGLPKTKVFYDNKA